MASNKIHLGNTKIVSAAGAPEGIVIASPTKSGTMALLSDVGGGASPVDTYTKTEIDDQQDAQDADIVINNDEIARQQIEITNNTANITKNDTAINKNILDIATNTGNIASNTAQIATNTADIAAMGDGGGVPTDTYTKAQIDEQQGIQDSNISSNTTAIGTLSGQVGQNSEDIAELQDSIFFSSAYSADYPSSPNRDPENGNMYLQNFAMFTYSYASATQIFASKTDESGNVRQFTAIQPGDSIVLNEVDSPNYGRYELVSIEEVSESYVVMNVIPKLGEGTIVAGVKVAFQGFPKPDSGDSYTKAESDAIDDAQDVIIATKIDEAPIDGKEYARKDAEWVEVTGGDAVAFKGRLSADQTILSTSWIKVNLDISDFDTDSAFADGKFQPSVSGYYQLNGAVLTASTASSVQTVSSVWKNGVLHSHGSSVSVQPADGESKVSSVGDVIYLNGTTDYLELFAYITTSGVAIVSSLNAATYLSAVLVTGGTGTGGIPEAPVDGKQYGRQDAEWTEVTGGGGDAQPPVAFSAQMSNEQILTSGVETKVNFDTTELDTDNSFDVSENSYVIKKEGIYLFNYCFRAISDPNTMSVVEISLFVNDVKVKGGQNTMTGENSAWAEFMTDSDTIKLDVGDTVCVKALVNGTNPKLGGGYQTVFSGNMISSITEGEVKEKEAVVFKAELKTPQSIASAGGGKKINIDDVTIDTINGFVDGKFKPSVAGYYHVEGRVNTAGSNGTIAYVGKNGTAVIAGSSIYSSEKGSKGSITTGIVYLDGENDYVELLGNVTSSVSEDIAILTGYGTFLSAHLITGQSSGGGSGGGGTTDILPVLYSGTVNTDGTVKDGTGFTSARQSLGTYRVTFDTPPTESWVINATPATSVGTIGYVIVDGAVNFYMQNAGYVDSSDRKDAPFSFTVTGTETIAVGGGGSYTPEPMVWEDVTAERTLSTVYTNTNDVPLEVIIGATSPSSNSWAKLLVDDVEMGRLGQLGGSTDAVLLTQSVTVPSGSTYELRERGTPDIQLNSWNEARIPIAIGTGGKTVAFRANLSADQTITNVVFTKVNLDTASTDTDSAFTDGKFKPSVAGYYQVNGSVQQSCSPSSTQTVSAIYKNGVPESYGNAVISSSASYRSNLSDVIYLNGTTDYLELYGYVTSTGTCSINGLPERTFLSAVLVSGGSASGDSIWTETDGDAIYDGNVGIGTTSPTTTLNVSNDGTAYPLLDEYETQQVSNSEIAYTKWVQGSKGIANLFGVDTLGGICGTASNHPFVIRTNNTARMTIAPNGVVTCSNGLSLVASDISTPPNMVISASGLIRKSTAVFYSTEEIDEKLAIKDKLIEKLSARLDELEKRLKK